jgi:hypothetical protein
LGYLEFPDDGSAVLAESFQEFHLREGFDFVLPGDGQFGGVVDSAIFDMEDVLFKAVQEVVQAGNRQSYRRLYQTDSTSCAYSPLERSRRRSAFLPVGLATAPDRQQGLPARIRLASPVREARRPMRLASA